MSDKKTMKPNSKRQNVEKAKVNESGQINKVAEFHLYAPQATQVNVAGSFNAWNTTHAPLEKDYQGNWRAQVSLKPGRYEYRFFVDGHWVDDSQAKETVPNGMGARNAVMEVK